MPVLYFAGTKDDLRGAKKQNMKLIIIRHGDPDYVRDSLTEKGWREAALLSEWISRLDVKEFYVSPLGRARDTASLTLEKMGREATVCDWLKEFPVRIRRPDVEGLSYIAWDWLPQDWMQEPAYVQLDSWAETEIMREAHVREEYDRVTGEFDRLLAGHGYVRDGRLYRVKRANHDTLVFFCHFGLECVLLSRLFNVSPMIFWHHFCAVPSSVTTLVTEERRRGTAVFRMLGFGDITHLNAGNEEPSFAARFCETYDSDERHD